jgi:hypothetical protein
VPAGTYWIYGAVNTSGGENGPWEEGDYVGDLQITVDGDETVNLTFEVYEENHEGACQDLGNSSLEGSMTILEPVDNGIWVVVIDENSGPSDGSLTCQEGIIPASTTTFDYEISSKIPAGTYKVYVMIFGNGNMDHPIYASNSYEVTFTGEDTQHLDFPLLTGIFCDDAGDSTLNGTLTIPDSAEGGFWWILIDDDLDMDNGWTTCFSGIIPNLDTLIPYEVPGRIPAGTYYVYLMIFESYNLDDDLLYTAGFDGSMQVTFSGDDNQTLDINIDIGDLIGLWKQVDDEENDYILHEPDVDFDVDGTDEDTGVWNYLLFTSTTLSEYRKIVYINYDGGPDTTSIQIGNVYIEEDDKNMGPYSYSGTILTLGSDQLYLTFDEDIMIISEDMVEFKRFKKVDESEVDNEIVIPDDDI